MERVIACTGEQCVCGHCGSETTVIGYEQSEQLDVEPAKYYVLVSDRVIVDTVLRKYADHAPLYRQSVILNRDASIEVSRATLDGWVMRVGELLMPISELMRRELISGHYIQADENAGIPVGNRCRPISP